LTAISQTQDGFAKEEGAEGIGHAETRRQVGHSRRHPSRRASRRILSDSGYKEVNFLSYYFKSLKLGSYVLSFKVISTLK
jgi:aspartyl/asparaginyl beta-hydroxylase (cupin superfamily)